MLLTESPYLMAHEKALAWLSNVVWTNERCIVDELRAVNPRTHYLPHAWLPGVHDQTDGEAPAHDVVFVGTGFSERVALLEGVDWTGIDLGLYGNWPGVSEKLQPFVRKREIPNTEAVALYRHAKIGLNLYRTTAGINMDSLGWAYRPGRFTQPARLRARRDRIVSSVDAAGGGRARSSGRWCRR